jgi:hypothetical protein
VEGDGIGEHATKRRQVTPGVRLVPAAQPFDVWMVCHVRPPLDDGVGVEHSPRPGSGATVVCYGPLFPDELAQLAERLQEVYVDAVTDRARTDAASGAAGNGKGAGR